MAIGYPQTRIALRSLVFDTLTTPQLTWAIDGGPVNTLPNTQVVPRLQVLPTEVVSFPRVVYTVRRLAQRSQYLWGEQNFRVTIQVVASAGEMDDCEFLYQSIYNRLHNADQEHPWLDLSRPSIAPSKPPISVRRFREDRCSDVDLEKETQRWYLTAEYFVAAV